MTSPWIRRARRRRSGRRALRIALGLFIAAASGGLLALAAGATLNRFIVG